MGEPMPKYTYRCNTCEKTWDVWHSMSELITDCECGSTFVFRVPSTFTTLVMDDRGRDRKVGEATKEGIEENREVLKQMKEQARTQEYDSND